MESSDESENEINFDINKIFNVNSPQNHRIIILGNSGSGKTTTFYDLVFNHLPKHLRHIYISGAEDNLKNSIIPLLQENGIEIYNKIINNANDLNINFNKLHRGDLLLIDDLSQHIKGNNKITEFLNKAFTTSRHNGFNIIVILHKLKLNNVMMRNNATKIILTSLDNEYLKEFGDNIINDKIRPIVLNPLNNFQQEKLISETRRKGGALTQVDLIQRIKNFNTIKIPKFERKNTPLKFIKIDSNNEEYNYQIPAQFLKLLNKMTNKNNTLIFDRSNPFEDEIIKDATNLRSNINQGESLAGNDNTNIIKPKRAPVYRTERRK